ncbi:hypothetical protein ACE6H2_015050 [Prunus campanulata]
MKKYGNEQSSADHSLFLIILRIWNTLFLKRHSGKQSGKLTTLIIYVDDIIVTHDDLDEIGKLKGYLASEFDMRDLSGFKYILGIEVTRSAQGIFLSQRKYVLDLLKDVSPLVLLLNKIMVWDITNTFQRLPNGQIQIHR